MSVVECRACGATLGMGALDKSARCGSCGTTTVNDRYFDLFAANMDVSRYHNAMQVAIAKFRSQDYAGALPAFETALMENSEDAEPWCFAACSAAHLATQADLLAASARARSFLQSARSTGKEEDTVDAAEEVVNNELAEIALRGMERARRDARNDYFAYESTNKADAARRRAHHSDRCAQLGVFVLDSPRVSARLKGKAASEIIECSKFTSETVAVQRALSELGLVPGDLDAHGSSNATGPGPFLEVRKRLKTGGAPAGLSALAGFLLFYFAMKKIGLYGLFGYVLGAVTLGSQLLAGVALVGAAVALSYSFSGVKTLPKAAATAAVFGVTQVLLLQVVERMRFLWGSPLTSFIAETAVVLVALGATLAAARRSEELFSIETVVAVAGLAAAMVLDYLVFQYGRLAYQLRHDDVYSTIGQLLILTVGCAVALRLRDRLVRDS